MRRAILVVLVLAAPASANAASLHLVSARPLKVRGTAFHRHERVRLVVRRGTAEVASRRVRAGRHGRLRAAFDLSSPPCGRLRVTATGADGSHAELPGLKYPDCVVD